MSEQGYRPSHIELMEDTRDALRRIRRAVTTGLIGVDETQEYTRELLDRFAKALLAIKRPRLLREEDKGSDPLQTQQTHVEELQKYIRMISQQWDIQPLYTGGSGKIDEDRANFVFDMSTGSRSINYFLKLFKMVEGQDQEIVALLSTGALPFAFLVYLYELSVTYAASDQARENAFVPEIVNDKVIVVDDTLGYQVKSVVRELASRGKKISITDFKGTTNPR